MSDPTTRLNSALEGRYRVGRQIGEGGMATVYLAEDLKHHREVALKVLKPELTAVVGAERFLAEIETTAKLTHPHILPLHDSGEADGFLFFVAPYIEGDTLRDKIDREKQLSVEEALEITKRVASALDYAHKHGVVHRDIKPGNILLSEEGEPTVADFGIALAVAQAGGGRVTETGLSVGTPHCMSPEQATGDRDVDPRTDVYALGSVLYEMLVGEPPYLGTTAQAVLAKILTDPAPAPTKLRLSIPPNVDAAIRKALEKLPADRFTGAQEFARALTDSGFRHGEERAAEASAKVGVWKGVSVALAVAAIAASSVAAWSLLHPEPPQRVSRQVLSTEGLAGLGTEFERSVALAPDGSSMILPIGGQLGLKMRGSTEITPIAGTAGAVEVVYSPDAEWIAYSVGTELFKRPVVGGSAVRLAGDLPALGGVLGLAWLDDGTILYEQASEESRRLVRISENGGEPLEAILGDEEELRISWVEGLPGARGTLVTACPGGTCLADQTQLLIVNLEDLSSQTVSEQVLRGWYAPTGHIVYTRSDGAVFAQPFDPVALELTGSAFPLFAGVRATTRSNSASADMWLSADGTLLYVEGPGAPAGGQLRLVEVDLDGNETPLVMAPRAIPNYGIGWSPDGGSVVFTSEGHIYTYNVTLGTTPRQLTFVGSNIRPVYSPDGSRVAFSSNRDGTDNTDLFVKDLNDDSPPRSIITLDARQLVAQWPSDSLIIFERDGGGVRDLWMVDLSDPDNPSAEAYLSSEANLQSISVSPDETLAAYRSNEAGSDEIYIRSFPDPGERTIVSQGGGLVPFWSPDGNTLYYYGAGVDRPLMAARLQRDPVPVVLSTDTLFQASRGPRAFPGSALHPDGDRFILARNVTDATGAEDAGSEPERLILVLNFFEELRQVVPE